MALISFQVVDGVDRGRTFMQMETPITIGREEGNTVRLNDERVSRFHAKIQEDQGQVVLTDLDSTNGTRVNGETVQLRLLRPGDRVCVGRSTLVFGSPDEIAAVVGGQAFEDAHPNGDDDAEPRLGLGTDLAASDADFPGFSESQVDVFHRTPPALPNRLSPAQAAQLSEVMDFLHRALADAIDAVHIPPRSREARLPISSWQRIQMVLGFLAQYSRRVGEPSEARGE